MDHNDIRHMLSEYIDGAVSAEDKTAIEDHLRTCEKCSEALRELRQTVAHIKTVEEIDPPAWMTQKIMATVRAEAEKKSWLRRLFFPLPVKLPLEAIGVLFIAVTALFIYQNMHPSQKAARPLLQDQMPGKEPASTVIARNAAERAAEPLPRSKDIPQSPGYKALDMKQEYEQPAPPSLQDQAAAPAPVPAERKPAYRAEQDQVFLNKEEATGREMLQGRSATSSGAAPEPTMKAKAAAPLGAADKAIPAIKMVVTDRESAAKEVERAIAQVKGTIVRRESRGPKIVFFVTVSAQRTGELIGKLKLLGEVTQEPREGTPQKDPVEFRIEITRKL